MRSITFYDIDNDLTGKNSYTDFNCLTLKYDVSEPRIKERTVDVSGRDGSLDLSEAVSSFPVYYNRELRFDFRIVGNDCQQYRKLLVKSLHGKRKLIAIEDQEHFFRGRCIVQTILDKGYYIELNVIVTAEPYKVDRNPIQKTATISGSGIVNVTNNGDSRPSPIIATSGNITINYDNETHTLSAGTHLAPFTLLNGMSDINITGNANVEFTYWEGYLV